MSTPPVGHDDLAALGTAFERAAPPADQPREQLLYLQRMIAALERLGHPRLASVKRKVAQALAQLERGAHRGDDPRALAERLARELGQLRTHTYELLLTVVNEARTVLRVKLRQGADPRSRFDIALLQAGLSKYTQGLRKILVAIRKRDAAAEKEAAQLIDEALSKLEQAGGGAPR